MIGPAVDERVRLDTHRVDLSDYPRSLRRLVALFWNRIRIFAERRAVHHVTVLLAQQPVALEKMIQAATTEGGFRENRATRVVDAEEVTLPPTMNPQEEALYRLQRLSAIGRERRYARGRRNFQILEGREHYEPSPK